MNTYLIGSLVPTGALRSVEGQKTLKCKETLVSFDADKPTITEMRQYASCVERIYPAPQLNPETTFLIKGAILVIFASMILGVWMCRHKPDASDLIFGAVIGFCMACLSLVFTGAAIAAIFFLFS